MTQSTPALSDTTGNVFVVHVNTKAETLQEQYPGCMVIDVTSKAKLPWQKFSPFYPHGAIPVPTADGLTSASVEGIWQGLKVFELQSTDCKKLEKTDMKDLKRFPTKVRGKVLGHALNLDLDSTAPEKLLGYVAARRRIYLPAYRTVLERMQVEIAELRRLQRENGLVLLDYGTNDDVEDERTPLSHAGLIKLYLEGRYPE
ncbi:hypothetical protein HDU88_004230 [Geranomyces variabilis]|nr:hypothetical protein HDU88_004230 [Geranomyces variabilis]